MRLNTQVFQIPGVSLQFGYTASKLQSLFGRRDKEQRSQVARRQKEEKEKKKYYKCFSWALDFGLDQRVKNYGLLGAMKPEDRQYYQFVKVTI